LGKVPGVLVEENKRKKIVKELGGEFRGEKSTKVGIEQTEEEKKGPEVESEGLQMVS
jgi:hypothetical protein